MFNKNIGFSGPIIDLFFFRIQNVWRMIYVLVGKDTLTCHYNIVVAFPIFIIISYYFDLAKSNSLALEIDLGIYQPCINNS